MTDTSDPTTTTVTAPVVQSDTPTIVDSFVQSPARIRLVVGLIAPFLTEDGKAEVERVWKTDPDTLFREAVDLAGAVKDHPALHAALGVWTRNHTFPAAAVERVGRFLEELPDDLTQAQSVLDAWAAEHTHNMIEKFPCAVDKDTHAVLASALAIDDTWARGTAAESMIRFKGVGVPGFRLPVEPGRALSTGDGRAVRVALPLASGMELVAVASTFGVGHAQMLINEPVSFTENVRVGQPFITTHQVYSPTEDVFVAMPEYTIRSTLNIGEDAAKWGLAAAMVPYGVPGLGDMEVTDARQDAFIEVTHTGVKAAAVTALMLMRSASMMSANVYRPMVDFNEPFAYQILMPGIETPLFEGVYSG